MSDLSTEEIAKLRKAWEDADSGHLHELIDLDDLVTEGEVTLAAVAHDLLPRLLDEIERRRAKEKAPAAPKGSGSR